MKLLIITLLTILVVASNASLPPEVYCKSMLPTTPMPKAITALLRPGNDGGKLGHVGVHLFANGFYYNSYRNNHTRHHPPLGDNVGLFFLERALHHGTKFNLHFTQTSNVESTFLPCSLANSIPFSLDKVNYILNKFNIKAGSNEAENVHTTISGCEEPTIKGEEKSCVTSLESMVDFITSKLRNNVVVVSTQVTKESELQQYTMAQGFKKLCENGKGSVVSHKVDYTYAVFFCHKSNTTRVYFVPLEGTDRNIVKAIALCHTNTSNWNPNHLAFEVLKVQPGTVPICHFLNQDHVVFVPK